MLSDKNLPSWQCAAPGVFRVCVFTGTEMKLTLNQARKYGAQLVQDVNTKALAVGTAVMLPLIASAQSTDPFEAAVTAMTTKVTTYGGLLVAFAAVSVGFLIAIKYVKKIPRSA